MVFEQVPLGELTTAAGITAAALAIRQIIEITKKSLWTWLDAGNERKAAIIAAAVLYLVWLIFYGTDLGKDGPAAFAAFFACATAAMGANEAVDAAKGTIAKNVGPGSDGDAENRGEAAAAVAAASAAGTVAVAVPSIVIADPEAVAAAEPETEPDEPDTGAPAEEPPDVDLNVNGGDPLDDDDDLDQVDDPATGTGI